MAPLQSPAKLFAGLMVPEAPALALLKVEPAVLQQKPFMGVTLAMRDGSCLKDWLN